MKFAAATHFPPERSDDTTVAAIATQFLREFPDWTDEDMGKLMLATWRPDFRGPMVWPIVMIERVKNGKHRQKAKPKCKVCGDLGVIQNPKVPDHGPKLLAALEAKTPLTIACPDRCEASKHASPAS